VPAGGPFVPSPLQQGEPSLVARALEAGLRHDGLAADHFQIEPRLQGLVGEPELHERRLEQNAPAIEQRQEIGRVLSADIHRRMPWIAALEAPEQAKGVTIRRRMERLPTERHGREQRYPGFGVEDRHRQTLLTGMDPKFDGSKLVRPGWGEPCTDSGCSSARLRRGSGEVARRLREPRDAAATRHAPASAPTTGSPPPIAPPRFAVASGVGGLGYRLRSFAPGLSAPRLVSDGDEECGHVFAMLSRLVERWAGAVRLDAFRGQVDAHGVGIGVRSFDPAVGARFSDLYVLDDAPTGVVEAAQKCPCSKQAAQPAVAERR